MNGLAHHDHRRPAAEAVRLLDRRRRLRRRGAASSSTNLDQTDAHDARSSGLGVLAVLLVLPRFTTQIPAVLVAVVGATVVSAVLGPGGRGRGDRRRAAAGRADAVASRGRASSDVGPLLLAAVGITLVSLDRHDRDRDELRGPARRRGRRRPGDGRHGRGEHRRRASSRGSPSRPAARAPRWPSSPAPRARSPASSAPASSRCCCCSSPSLLADLPQTALAAVVIAAAFSLMDLGVLAPLRAGAHERRSCSRSSPRVGVDPLRRAAGHRRRRHPGDPAVLPAQLVAARRGARAGRRARRLAQRRATIPDASEVPGVVVYRWEAPLFFANAGIFREQVRRLVRERQPRLGRAAVRGDHRRRRHRRRDARAARRRAQRARASTWRSSSCAAASRTSCCATASFETLDRDHFYPTLKAAVRADRGPWTSAAGA